MGNLKFDANNYYFSGQGVVMIGHRDSVSGNPTGLRPVGNVSDLKITVATTVIDHKGSQDGQRAIDARLQTETKATASVTLDNWNSDNLAKSLRGTNTIVAAGSVSAMSYNGFFGLVTGFQHVRINNVVVKLGSTALTEYVNTTTAYDYKLNEDAGSIMLNNPTTSGQALVGLTDVGATPSALSVGTTTLLTVTIPSGSKIGDQVYLSGFTGANASLLNGKTINIISLGGGVIEVPIVTAGATITFGSASVFFIDVPQVLAVSYSYANQFLIDSLNQPLTDNWLRFEGLNTVAEGDPVVVDLFRFSNDPLKELALISDTFGQFILEGAVLSDGTRPPGVSPYFQIRKVGQ